MLTKYHSMPFSQYNEDYVYAMIDTIENQITNLDKESYNMTYKYRVTNELGGLIYEYNAGSFAINPYADAGYITHPPFAKPPTAFFFPIGTADSAEYTVTHFISSDENLPFKGNDTTTFSQKFYNYYAYDNGTPENGYGVEGDDNGMVAIKFALNKADTLRGINLYFNEILNPSADQSFYLKVWNHGDRTPGSVVYEQYEMRPEKPDYRNTFHTFILEEPVIINQTNFPNLIFYVGWQKDNDDEILNIGYDRSRDSKGNTFYNVNNIWYNSMQAGTVMVRPLLGKELAANTGIESTSKREVSFSIFPNPVNGDKIHFTFDQTNNSGIGVIIIRNAQGRVIREISASTTELEISNLPSGMYLAQLMVNSELLTTTKFIISK